MTNEVQGDLFPSNDRQPKRYEYDPRRIAVPCPYPVPRMTQPGSDYAQCFNTGVFIPTDMILTAMSEDTVVHSGQYTSRTISANRWLAYRDGAVAELSTAWATAAHDVRASTQDPALSIFKEAPLSTTKRTLAWEHAHKLINLAWGEVNQGEQWLHHNDIGVPPPGGDHARVLWWGLAMPLVVAVSPTDIKSESGKWRLSPTGWAFLRGDLTIPLSAYDIGTKGDRYAVAFGTKFVRIEEVVGRVFNRASVIGVDPVEWAGIRKDAREDFIRLRKLRAQGE